MTTNRCVSTQPLTNKPRRQEREALDWDDKPDGDRSDMRTSPVMQLGRSVLSPRPTEAPWGTSAVLVGRRPWTFAASLARHPPDRVQSPDRRDEP